MSDYDPAAFEAFERSGWRAKKGAVYDSLAGRVTARFADPLLDAIGADPGMRLLDVATGPGYVAARAAERGADPVGLDFSESMLAFARARSPGIELVHGDATALPFEDASFDAVVAAFLLLHLATPERAIEEAARVLKHGGRAAFSVWDEPSRGRWIGVFFDAVMAAEAHPPADLPAGPHFFRFADDAVLTSLLEEAGLADVTVERVEFDLHLDDADELWTGLIQGSVRVGPLILGQTEEVQLRVRRHFDELLEAYRMPDGLDVPVSAKLAVGRKA